MKEQLDYVQFDVDFLTKPKIVAIRFRYGAEGLLAYMQILFALGRATNAEITEDAFYGLMQLSGFSAEKATEMLGYFLTAEVLTRKQNGALTNSRIAEDQANVGQKRDKWRDNKRKQRGQIEDNDVDVPRDSEDHEHYEDPEDLNLEKKGVQGEEKPLPEPAGEQSPPNVAAAPDEFSEAAEKSLEKAHNQPWVRENPYILAGRRPMRNYPRVRLSAPVLAQILRAHSKAGLDLDDSKHIFRTVDGKLKSFEEAGRKCDYANAELWLTGWAMSERIEQRTKENRLKRSEEVPAYAKR